MEKNKKENSLKYLIGIMTKIKEDLSIIDILVSFPDDHYERVNYELGLFLYRIVAAGSCPRISTILLCSSMIATFG